MGCLILRGRHLDTEQFSLAFIILGQVYRECNIFLPCYFVSGIRITQNSAFATEILGKSDEEKQTPAQQVLDKRFIGRLFPTINVNGLILTR